MSKNISDDEIFSNELVEDILSKLTGKHEDYKRLILPNYPQKLLILGSLSEEDPSFMDNESASVKSNSLTVLFITKDPIKIKVKPRLSLYYGVNEEVDELKSYGLKREKDSGVPFVWKRLETDFDFFELTEEKRMISLGFQDYINLINNDLEHESFYDKKKPKYAWNGAVSLETYTHPDIPGAKIVKIHLINKTEPVKKKEKKYETAFFNCGLDISFNDVKLIHFVDKRTNDFGNVKEIKSLVKTFNCGFNWTDDKAISTTPYKIAEQISIVPRNTFSIDDEDFFPSFEELSQSTDLLKKLLRNLKIHNDLYREKLVNDVDPDKKIIKEKFEYVLSRYEEGIQLLENNEVAKKAFFLMQKTFANLTKNKEYHSWRIFQIVFIVSLIPDVINNNCRRNEVELLHVATGGGKSESYFGLVVFSAFYDRLNGKKFGTTAITKFPLRMLSVDQLQRIANIFIIAEEIRKNEIPDNSAFPFSVAYFVGSSDEFPRNTKKLIEELQRCEKENKLKEGKIISDCPLCEIENKDYKNSVILSLDKSSMKIAHKCKTCGKSFDLFFTDEEIYRFLPTFIISTVDKFAGISLQRRFKNLFGGELNSCTKGHGFIPRGDFCEVNINHEQCKDEGDRCDIDFATTPSIIVQDEMHLIREGFGTIESHFETFIETLSKTINSEKFKHITMTATIKGAEEQNNTVYWKNKTNIFPWHSPIEKGISDPFYIKNEDKKQRIIVGLKPNFRDNQYACLLTIRYLAEFIQSVESNFDEYSSKLGLSVDVLKSLVRRYKCLMTYHNKKSDVNTMNFYMSPVVNSKLKQYDYSIVHNILTGDNSLDEIRNQIKIIKEFEQEQKKLSVLSCTSIVSHGVDISRWNFMCFQGIPGSTAEYIQALSRVGRKDLGIVFLWFYPNRVRDISLFDNFVEFNEERDLFVESVPIERWTKWGFQQTFHSLFCGSILNYLSFELKKPIYSVKHVMDVFFSEDDVQNDAVRKKLITFLEDSYHVHEGKPNSNFMIETIANETKARLNYLFEYSRNKANDQKVFFPNILLLNDKQYWKNQFGMRGIQDTIGLANYQEKFIERYKNE
ncbi:MAG: helicase-related protein [Candidatus Woesearchaeota archaeon]